MTLAAPAFLDAQHLVSSYGLLGLLAIIFAETGLLLGFFLPGDSLLFIAGFAAAGNLGGLHQSIAVVCLAVSLAAIAGAQVGHWIGWKTGPILFYRRESRLFRREYVDRAEHVFQRFGPARAVVLARFVPIVRTFMNPVAGVLRMPPREFLVWNVIGGALWGCGVTLLGYFLGNVDVVRKHIELFILAVVAVSLVPIAFELLRSRNRAGERP